MLPVKQRIALVTLVVIAGFGAFLYFQSTPSPCEKIRAACETQGFKRGKTVTERRAFKENCFSPLLEGQTVGTLKIEEDLLNGCKERQAKRRGRRGNDKGQGKEKEPDDEARL